LAEEGELGGCRIKSGTTKEFRHPGPDPGSSFFFIPAMERLPCVYLLASGFHGTLYTVVTSQLLGRIWQHREEVTKGFNAQYQVKRLVWFEVHETMESAIRREKLIKRWRRAWKIELVEAGNPTWRDLAEDFGFESLVKRRWTPDQVRGDEIGTPGMAAVAQGRDDGS
jgi:putative endonuclease